MKKEMIANLIMVAMIVLIATLGVLGVGYIRGFANGLLHLVFFLAQHQRTRFIIARRVAVAVVDHLFLFAAQGAHYHAWQANGVALDVVENRRFFVFGFSVVVHTDEGVAFLEMERGVHQFETEGYAVDDLGVGERRQLTVAGVEAHIEACQ